MRKHLALTKAGSKRSLFYSLPRPRTDTSSDLQGQRWIYIRHTAQITQMNPF